MENTYWLTYIHKQLEDKGVLSVPFAFASTYGDLLTLEKRATTAMVTKKEVDSYNPQSTLVNTVTKVLSTEDMDVDEVTRTLRDDEGVLIALNLARVIPNNVGPLRSYNNVSLQHWLPAQKEIHLLFTFGADFGIMKVPTIINRQAHGVEAIRYALRSKAGFKKYFKVEERAPQPLADKIVESLS